MIEKLSESAGSILAVKATEKLTVEDYENIFIPELDKLIKQYGKIRVLIYLDTGFKGWEIEAIWDDAKYGINHREDFEKLAIVGGPAWVRWTTKMSACLIQGEVETFTDKQLQKALNWISE